VAAPRIPDDRLREFIELVETALREGYPRYANSGAGAVRMASREAVTKGWFANSDQGFTWINLARERLELEPDWSAYRPRQYQHVQPGAPLIPDQGHLVEPEPEGEPIRVLVIGDAHDSPHLRDKSRFRWLGAYCEERGLGRVVSVGDWLTMDCFSSHTDRATFEGFAKPTFEQDIESFHESQRAFQDGLAGHRPKKDICLGNHEHRAYRYDGLHPDGMSHAMLLDEAFAQWGWRTSRYGEYRFIEGVGFVHVPFNALGRPLTQNQRPNKAMFDTVHGDDHRGTMLTDFKSGPVRSPTVYSAATALPPGFIEGFSNKGASTWRSGVCEAVLWGGYVRSWRFTEMVLLRHRYGRSGEGAERSVAGWAP
jgi:hypothetical protein